jgi:hypothetical protein
MVLLASAMPPVALNRNCVEVMGAPVLLRVPLASGIRGWSPSPVSEYSSTDLRVKSGSEPVMEEVIRSPII